MNRTIKLILRIHIASLILLLSNLILIQTIEHSLNSDILLCLKATLYISAVILFFAFRKPFTKISFYFSTYIFTPIVLLLSWLLGMVGVFLTSIFIMAFFPKIHLCESDNYVIYEKFEGFLNARYKHMLFEKKYLIFEKKISDFETEESDFKNLSISIKKDSAYIKFTYEDIDYDTYQNIEIDSIIKTKIK